MLRSLLSVLLLMLPISTLAAKGAESFESMVSAIEANDITRVKALLSKGVDPNLRVDTRASPTFLTHAAYRGRNEIVQLLVGAGADLEATNGDGYTPLMMAAFAGQMSTVKSLLSRRVDLNAVGYRGETALSLAKEGKNSEIVTLLRKAGAKQ